MPRLRDVLLVVLALVFVVAVFWWKYKRVGDGDPIHFVIWMGICFGVAFVWEAGKKELKRRRAQRPETRKGP